MKVKAFLFDVFGSTVDWQNCVHRQLQAKCKNLSNGPDLLQFTIDWREDYMAKIKASADRGDTDTNIMDLIRQSLNELTQKDPYTTLGSGWNDADKDEVCTYWSKLDGWKDTEELQRVKDKAIIAALSNGNLRILLDIAKHANLPWDMIFSCQMIQAFKPNPKAYQRPVGWLDLDPSEVAMVAAHIYDLKAAASQGLRTIYIPRETEDVRDPNLPKGPSSVKPKSEGGEVDAVIHSFGELVNYC